MIYVNRQVLSDFKNSIDDNNTYIAMKHNYKILYNHIEDNGFKTKLPEYENNNDNLYIALYFLFQIRTLYKNTIIIPIESHHIYEPLKEDIFLKGNSSLEQIVLGATMQYIRYLVNKCQNKKVTNHSIKEVLANFLPNTEPLPLGVLYDSKSDTIQVYNQLILSDETDITFAKVAYKEVPYREIEVKAEQFDNADYLFYNKFIVLDNKSK